MIKLAVCLVVASLASTGAWADAQRPIEFDPVSTARLPTEAGTGARFDLNLNRVGRQKLALGLEAARLRDADGGTLTPAHRASLQRRLDRINVKLIRTPRLT